MQKNNQHNVKIAFGNMHKNGVELGICYHDTFAQ